MASRRSEGYTLPPAQTPHNGGKSIVFPAQAALAKIGYSPTHSRTDLMEATRTFATNLVTEWERTGSDAWERLLPIVYDELRRVASRQLAQERGDATLQTTALVHEAFLRLVDHERVTRKGRSYFFAAAARAMRQVLVDQARRRNAQKRGGGEAPVTLTDQAQPTGDVDLFAIEMLELDQALAELADLNPRHARVVECRFYAGMSVADTAEALEISERTVKNDWSLARAWLFRRLGGLPQGQYTSDGE
jgi:RNA polymerase sigma-70 factor (ECF subfamily)